jgi:hypothetical protein
MPHLALGGLRPVLDLRQQGRLYPAAMCDALWNNCWAFPIDGSKPSIGRRETSRREFDPTIGELPPIFHDNRVPRVRRLIDDFASFPACGFNR